jgi:hypothetical protein
MMPEPLVFQFDLRLDEMLRASRAVWSRHKLERTLRWGVPLFAAGIIVLSWAASGNLVAALQATWVSLAVLLVIVYGLLPFLRRRSLTRAYRANPKLLGMHTYTFTETSLTMAGPLTSVTLAWDALQKAVETDEFFLFYPNRNWAYYVPKRAVDPVAAGSLERSRL